MRVRFKLLFATGVLAFAVLGTLYAIGRIGTYRVGRDISDLGLDPAKDGKYAEFSWSVAAYETLPEYCQRVGCSLETFTGVLQLNAPGTDEHESQLGIVNGIASRLIAKGHDGSLAGDLGAGWGGGIEHMLKGTRNDWRISEHEGYIMLPHRKRFNGTIFLRPRTDIGTAIRLEVVENRIVGVSRHFYID